MHVHEGHLVFAEKVGSDGDVTRKKVRLVTKGYMEVWGEDYWHTYSPTLGRDTLFSCLAYAATHDLEIHQLDGVAAYLNSDLTEEIYLQPPDGVPTSLNTVWCLKKALYGLKQAGLEWYCTLWSHIQSIGYAQSGYDPCLYACDSENFTVVYVDDLLLFAPKKQLAHTKSELASVGGISVCCKTRLQVPDSRVQAWSQQSCLRRDKIQYFGKVLQNSLLAVHKMQLNRAILTMTLPCQ